MTLSSCLELLVAHAQGLNALSRKTGLDAGYLSRLREGEKTNPSEATLKRLGIERVVSYRIINENLRKAPK